MIKKTALSHRLRFFISAAIIVFAHTCTVSKAGDPKFANPVLLYAADANEVGPLVGPTFTGPEQKWNGSHPRPIPWDVWQSSANVIDIDQDGLRDLVIQTNVYLNTDRYRGDVPVFGKRRELSEFIDYDEPDGELSAVYPDGWCGTMCFADLDGDGVMDIVTSSRKGPFRWWKGIGQKEKRRQFKYQGRLIEASANAELKCVMKGSVPPPIRVVDWDADGRPDLIVGIRLVDYGSPLQIKPPGGWDWETAYAGKTWLGGDSLGALMFHKNVGTREKPKFTLGIPFRIGKDQHLGLFYDAVSPEVVDYDEDGLLDIVACTFDRLVFYRNAGTPTEPKLDDGVVLQVDGQDMLPFQRATLTLANWKKGDRNDLLFCSNRLIFHAESTGSRRKPKYKLSGPVLAVNPPLVVDAEAIPHICDWNDDGKLDLLVGCGGGFITYFENCSTATPPGLHFRHGKQLQVKGKPLRVLSDYGMTGRLEGLWGYTGPVTADWDGDGDLDILTGSVDPSIDYFENIGTRKKPRLAAGRKITVDGKILPHDWRSRPTANDWNGDGLLDLMVATMDGSLSYYERQRKNGKLSLKPAITMLDTEGKALYIRGEQGRKGGRVKLTAMDWDKDGDLDILIGSRVGRPSPGWLENVGTNKKPVFKIHHLVIPMVGGHFRMVEPYDWDGDGDMDLIIGSDSGGIFYIEQI